MYLDLHCMSKLPALLSAVIHVRSHTCKKFGSDQNDQGQTVYLQFKNVKNRQLKISVDKMFRLFFLAEPLSIDF